MTGTVLVTGATGFIGTEAVTRLKERGFTPLGASRDPRITGIAGLARMPDAAVPAQAWDALVAGAAHVVHCAGISESSSAIAVSAYRQANVEVTAALGEAALRNTGGRFVFLSSSHADEKGEPVGEYGRSKRDAELRLLSIFAGQPERLVILRPAPVYGPRLKGGFAALLRLARLPVPLPLAGLSARKSVLDVTACADAIVHALCPDAVPGGIYIVSDAHAHPLPELVASMRKGLGRPARLFPVPAWLLKAPFLLAGKGAAWDRLAGEAVADPSALAATGWTPPADTLDRLARYVAAAEIPH